MIAEIGPETMDGGVGGTDTIDLARWGGDYVVDMNVGSSNYGGELYTNFENLISGAGNDIITGTADDDVISTDAGDDSIIAGPGNRHARTAAHGNDTLNGGSGADSMSGNDGDDSYYVDNAGDIVFENWNETGNDTVYSTLGYYQLTNYVENLYLVGGGNQDGKGNFLANMMFGNAFDNLLEGANSIDTLYGGAGNDTLDGGAGADCMVRRDGRRQLQDHDLDRPGRRTRRRGHRHRDLGAGDQPVRAARQRREHDAFPHRRHPGLAGQCAGQRHARRQCRRQPVGPGRQRQHARRRGQRHPERRQRQRHAGRRLGA